VPATGARSVVCASVVRASSTPTCADRTWAWDKGAPVIGHGDYHYAHEPIVFAYAGPSKGRGRGQGGWYGGNDKTSVIHVPKPARSREHPTMKPIELLRQLISNSSRRSQLVVTPSSAPARR
jgi:DNA modification methylase